MATEFSQLDPTTARIEGLVPLFFASLNDTLAHGAIGAFKTLTGCVAVPYDLVVSEENKTNRTVTLKAAVMHFAIAIESLFNAVLLPMINLLYGSNKAKEWVENRREAYYQFFEASSLSNRPQNGQHPAEDQAIARAQAQFERVRGGLVNQITQLQREAAALRQAAQNPPGMQALRGEITNYLVKQAQLADLITRQDEEIAELQHLQNQQHIQAQINEIENVEQRFNIIITNQQNENENMRQSLYNIRETLGQSQRALEEATSKLKEAADERELLIQQIEQFNTHTVPPNVQELESIEIKCKDQKLELKEKESLILELKNQLENQKATIESSNNAIKALEAKQKELEECIAQQENRLKEMAKEDQEKISNLEKTKEILEKMQTEQTTYLQAKEEENKTLYSNIATINAGLQKKNKECETYENMFNNSDEARKNLQNTIDTQKNTIQELVKTCQDLIKEKNTKVNELVEKINDCKTIENLQQEEIQSKSEEAQKHAKNL